MASPKTKDGYSIIANELLKAIYRFPFSGQEFRIILWTVRNIYGWKGRKKTLPTSIRIIAEELGMSVSTVAWSLNRLSTRGVILRVDRGALRINSNYEEWLTVLPMQLELTYNNKNPGSSKSSRNISEKKENFPPSIEEVRAFCKGRNSSVDPDKFFKTYSEKGWISGKGQIKSWKSALCYWERTDYKGKKTIGTKICPMCEVHPIAKEEDIVCTYCGNWCRSCGAMGKPIKIVIRRDKTKTTKCVRKFAKIKEN